MARINKALLAAGVLLDKPGLTEADLVASATEALSTKVDRLQATIDAETKVVLSAQQARDAEIRRLENEFDAKTAAPKAKIADAKAKSEDLVKVYTQLTGRR